MIERRVGYYSAFGSAAPVSEKEEEDQMGIPRMQRAIPLLGRWRNLQRQMSLRKILASSVTAAAVFTMLAFLYGYTQAASQSDFDNAISSLSFEVEQTTRTERAASNILFQTNAVDSALLVGGIETAMAGNTIDWPITFIPGPKPITALQADFLLPSNISITNVTAGPAAIAAGKSVAFSTNTNRALLFGLNQTPIGDGVVAIVTLKLVAVTSPGIYPAVLSNPVAADGTGMAVPICVTSGIIEVN